jgi:surfactin synthase thioesterase subunit
LKKDIRWTSPPLGRRRPRNCSPRLYAEQIPARWRFGPVTVADQTRDDSMAAIAARSLATAPACFALVGLSMGGYIAFF